MARTLPPVLRDRRRGAFLDATEGLIQTQGYERMTIQDVLLAVGASKGALYHYFDSKEALLDGVVERLTDSALVSVSGIVDDPSIPAPRKLERVFGSIAAFKAERRDLILAILDVWTSPANVRVREKVRQLAAARLGPVVGAVLRQGLEEGAFQGVDPEMTALVIVRLIEGFQEVATELFLARQAQTISLGQVRRAFFSFTQALERVLGAPEGSLSLADEVMLQTWFG